MGACLVSRHSSSNTGTGSGALPDTSRRAVDSARAQDSSPATRDHTVGTPKYRLPRAAAYASGVGLTVCTNRLPTRNEPSRPSTSPCT
ncbi:Uncharacterised protein [Mycobacteroides abscessus subsp. abscessus]|nr:Uncharacterised protein [Mycobacteroides abscessus subsp. abscessus]